MIPEKVLKGRKVDRCSIEASPSQTRNELIERQIVWLVELLPVKAVLALHIADGVDEEDQKRGTRHSPGTRASLGQKTGGKHLASELSAQRGTMVGESEESVDTSVCKLLGTSGRRQPQGPIAKRWQIEGSVHLLLLGSRSLSRGSAKATEWLGRRNVHGELVRC